MEKYSEEWLKEKELRHQEAMERKMAMKREYYSWNGKYVVRMDGFIDVEESNCNIVQWYTEG